MVGALFSKSADYVTALHGCTKKTWPVYMPVSSILNSSGVTSTDATI